MTIRIGHGFDVHAFGSDKGPIYLGGIAIPYERNFIAHSDGDVLLHSICDSLIGALALGDIGQHFPDTDPKYKNIDSKILLDLVSQLIKKNGYKIINIDNTIIAQEPKMSPYIYNMRKSISNILDIDIQQISVKATTSEKLGFTGRKEGIAVESVCLLEKNQ